MIPFIGNKAYHWSMYVLKGYQDVPPEFYALHLETLASISFLIPDQELAKNDVDEAEKYIKSIDVIEEQTGLDLFSNLEDSIESTLENKKGSLSQWSLYNRVPVRGGSLICNKR